MPINQDALRKKIHSQINLLKELLRLAEKPGFAETFNNLVTDSVAPWSIQGGTTTRPQPNFNTGLTDAARKALDRLRSVNFTYREVIREMQQDGYQFQQRARATPSMASFASL